MRRSSATLAHARDVDLVKMCFGCRRVASGDGNWEPAPASLLRERRHDVSHGLCPDCYERLYPSK